VARILAWAKMATLSGNELAAYNAGFDDGFKTGQASVNEIWILSAITNDGETLEEETTIHKTLAGVVAEIAAEWKRWRVLNYDSDDDSVKKEASRLSYEEPLSLEEVNAAFKNGRKLPVVLLENEEDFDGLFQLTLQCVQLLK
jgi:hypothetical protein